MAAERRDSNSNTGFGHDYDYDYDDDSDDEEARPGAFARTPHRRRMMMMTTPAESFTSVSMSTGLTIAGRRRDSDNSIERDQHLYQHQRQGGQPQQQHFHAGADGTTFDDSVDGTTLASTIGTSSSHQLSAVDEEDGQQRQQQRRIRTMMRMDPIGSSAVVVAPTCRHHVERRTPKQRQQQQQEQEQDEQEAKSGCCQRPGKLTIIVIVTLVVVVGAGLAAGLVFGLDSNSSDAAPLDPQSRDVGGRDNNRNNNGGGGNSNADLLRGCDNVLVHVENLFGCIDGDGPVIPACAQPAYESLRHTALPYLYPDNPNAVRGCTDANLALVTLATHLQSQRQRQIVLPEGEEELYFMLAVFYFATNGNAWMTSTGWLSSDTSPCDWHGVECTPNGEYTDPTTGVAVRYARGIELQSNNVRGTIPSEIGFLTRLGKRTRRKEEEEEFGVKSLTPFVPS